jgi:hypothetical protein
MCGYWGLGVAMVNNKGVAKKVVEKIPPEPSPLVSPATPDEGAELIRAFVAVKNPLVRKAIIAFVQKLA